ncbi:hypothetical protein EUGRSUZ_C00035 [Eucalyptus grandis]|uniref:Uncharacterized protein n=2 Tax=Eucalyptus grandis TaxID=71139 RepID=A0A059CKX7_EUCGR|nr:hypothetical protein EUGRSUZ_C00035 [Eucalyptus grandis]
MHMRVTVPRRSTGSDPINNSPVVCMCMCAHLCKHMITCMCTPKHMFTTRKNAHINGERSGRGINWQYIFSR